MSLVNESQPLLTASPKISEVIKRIISLIVDVPNFSSLEDLTFKCSDFLEVLKMDINYEGDDETKEKQQGRALFDRRKKFYQIIKASRECGFDSRRGLDQIKNEQLLMDSLMAPEWRFYPSSNKASFLLYPEC